MIGSFTLTQSTFATIILLCTFTCAFFSMRKLGISLSQKNIKTLASLVQETQSCNEKKGIEAKAIEVLKKSSWNKKASGGLDRAIKKIERLFPKEKELNLAGLSHSVNGYGLALSRIQFAIFAGATFSVVGCIMSGELGFVGLILGVVFGFQYPSMLLKKRTQKRAEELEKHLPEMLEILSISMRSGLSFDRALEIYSENFDTSLSKEFSNAQKLWMSGIKSRDSALRDITKTYDSMIFSRTVEALIRNLRLGTSVATSLLASSKEARAIYQSRREETVRKAPIKMMIPTGTLILPAMLLLIMGPVMLELVGGGV